MTKARDVAEQTLWHAAEIDLDRQLLGGGGPRNHGAHVIEDLGQGEFAALQLQPLSLDFREIKDIVDEIQQMPAGDVDRVQTLGLLLRRLLAQE